MIYKSIKNCGKLNLSHYLHTLSLSRVNARFAVCNRCLSLNSSPIKDNIYTIPNGLSLARILMSPMIAYSVVTAHHTTALALFGTAAITDFLDGQIARRYPSQRSLLGSIIDPIGDKLLIGCTTVSLWYTALLPSWFVMIVLFRDLALLGGGFLLKFNTLDKFSPRSLFNVKDASLEVKPGFHGKLNMCLQIGAVVASLASPIFLYQDSQYLLAYLCVCSFTSLYSLVQYMRTYKKVVKRVHSSPKWMQQSRK